LSFSPSSLPLRRSSRILQSPINTVRLSAFKRYVLGDRNNNINSRSGKKKGIAHLFSKIIYGNFSPFKSRRKYFSIRWSSISTRTLLSRRFPGFARLSLL
jgi:hypothetical protein